MPANEPDSTKYLVDQLKKSMGTCSKVITPIAITSSADLPKQTTDRLIKDVPPGLVACDCKIPDSDAFEWGVYTWFGESAPALGWIDLPKIVAGEKKPIGKLVH